MKNLFFAFSLKAPWPQTLPQGRHIDEKERHLTLAFLGPCEPVTPPPLPFKIGCAAQFDQCLFLPPKQPRVIAWHLSFLQEQKELERYVELLQQFVPEGKKRALLHHVTLARAPFVKEEWQDHFSTLPCYVEALHLYESLGFSHYRALSTIALLPPFEEIEHTADIAYKVRGKDLKELYCHASLALAFTFPPLLSYFHMKELSSLEEIVYALNQLLLVCDTEIGAPFKAISYHGEIKERDSILEWEMIVDV